MFKRKKKTLFKTAAVAACLGILLLSVPGMIQAEKIIPRKNTETFFSKPVNILFSIFPLFGSILLTAKKTEPAKDEKKDIRKIKITGGLTSDRPSDGD